MSAPDSSRARELLDSRGRPGGRCWVCGAGETRLWRQGEPAQTLEPGDLAITDSRYGLTLPLAECEACGFRFAMGEQLAMLESLYAALEDPAYEESSPARELQMDWLVAVMRAAHPTARDALDVGAAAGLLVRSARRAGLDAVGVEPSASLAKRARDEGLDVLTGVLPHSELGDRRFDLVFLVDVLEHVADPVDLLLRCREALKSDGRLLVVTPDVSSVAARWMGRRWWHFRLAHVGYFDRPTLTRAFDRARLVPVTWKRARWFFPISYLAERLERYLPIAWLNAAVARIPIVREIYRVTIPLDLRDSYAVVARRADPSLPDRPDR